MMSLNFIPLGFIIFSEVIMLLVGALECFAGCKIRKVMVSIWGFFIGMFIGTVIGFLNESAVMAIVFALIIGILLAMLAYRLYLAGLFILVGSLSAIMLYMIIRSVLVSVLAGVIIGGLSMLFERTVVVISTAVSGAAMLTVSACLLMGISDYYTLTILYVLWILLSAAGIVCQVITNSSKLRKRLAGQKKYINSTNLTFSERKYPGMQRAYRNYCINCGCALSAKDIECPRCHFDAYDYEV